MGTTPRTGNQYSIHHGDFSAVVCELGSKLRRFDYGGKEVFCSYGPDDLTPTCCGYILAPWPNRIKDGEYDFNCKHYCAPVNECHPEPRNNANHGYAYQYMWKLESLTENSVTQSLRFPNLDGYPFDVTVTATYELNDKGMTVTVSARNDGDEPAPWALGLHPWVANGKNGETSEQRDADSAACRLKIDADTHVTVDAGLAPSLWTAPSSICATTRFWTDARSTTPGWTSTAPTTARQRPCSPAPMAWRSSWSATRPSTRGNATRPPAPRSTSIRTASPSSR